MRGLCLAAIGIYIGKRPSSSFHPFTRLCSIPVSTPSPGGDQLLFSSKTTASPPSTPLRLNRQLAHQHRLWRSTPTPQPGPTSVLCLQDVCCLSGPLFQSRVLTLQGRTGLWWVSSLRAACCLGANQVSFGIDANSLIHVLFATTAADIQGHHRRCNC